MTLTGVLVEQRPKAMQRFSPETQPCNTICVKIIETKLGDADDAAYLELRRVRATWTQCHADLAQGAGITRPWEMVPCDTTVSHTVAYKIGEQDLHLLLPLCILAKKIVPSH